MKFLILVVALVGSVGTAFCAESVGEKAQAVGNDAGRSVKTGAHRVQEAVCVQSDAKCLAEKAKHRGEEGSDYAKDKVKQIKNDIDSDK